MKYLIFLFLFILIQSTNYEINKINPNILQKIPVYSRVDSFIYFESNFLSTNDIYLYLEDRAYYKSKIDICYTNDEPELSSTIKNCTFDSISPYKISRYIATDQYFYKFPKRDRNIIIQFKAKFLGILKTYIADHDLYDEIQKFYETPLSPLAIVLIVLGGVCVIGIIFIIIYICYLEKKIKKMQENKGNNVSNEPLNQPEIINQDIQNQEQTPASIINNE